MEENIVCLSIESYNELFLKAKALDKLSELIERSFRPKWDSYDISVCTDAVDVILGTSYKQIARNYKEEEEGKKGD